MGITTDSIAFLAAASRSGVDFDQTLTIGRQAMVAEGRRVRAGMRAAGLEIELAQARAISKEGAGYCEPLLYHLGARRIESLDASDFEQSTIVHDLNEALPPEHHGAYSAVFDGGTLEHVFDFPTALKTCLEAVAVGGHYLAITPVNNYAGHGFYQFTPELYFRVLCEENGYRIRCMLWRSDHPLAHWYRVADPAAVGRRVERRGMTRTQLYVAAQRVVAHDVLTKPPQQSDYVAAWSDSGKIRGSREVLGGFVGRLARRVPLRAKDTVLLMQQLATSRGRTSDFERVALPDVQFA